MKNYSVQILVGHYNFSFLFFIFTGSQIKFGMKFSAIAENFSFPHLTYFYDASILDPLHNLFF